MNKKITKIESYEEMSQRSSSLSHWLDESVNNDLIPHLEKAINAISIDEKDKTLMSVLSYWNGVVDGNRFNRERPSDEVLLKKKGSRVFYD